MKKAQKSQQGKQQAGEGEEGSTGADQGDAQPTPETTAEEEEEDDSAGGPSLSKDEIKAKLASRKTPSRKKSQAGGDASAKKTLVKGVGKASSASASSKTTGDIDTKRKKEIELVVPHKSVKSADIREMTEEAAKRKTPHESKDKVAYVVGDLATFASKMARLQAHESSKNNDELVIMLGKLLKETVIFRSDIERSGVAAIVLALRKKSTNPTVSSTASAVRKHMMKVMEDDTSGGTRKKHSTDGEPVQKTKKKQKTDSGASSLPRSSESAPIKSEKDGIKQEVGTKSVSALTSNETSGASTKAEVTDAAASATTNGGGGGVKAAGKKDTPTTVVAESPAPFTLSATKATDGEAGTAAAAEDEVFQGEVNLDKNRVVFVARLSDVLKEHGQSFGKLAKEIEVRPCIGWRSGRRWQCCILIVCLGVTIPCAGSSVRPIQGEQRRVPSAGATCDHRFEEQRQTA